MNANSECWKSAAKELARWIQVCFAIVYMDFTNKVKELSETLSMEHALDCRSFYGKNMTLDQRMDTMKAFCNQEFQVLCATESYEVGIHNPQVEFVARVGCMQSISVFMQELGRAGRTDDHSSDGLLLFNESKDDQRLGYCVKGCGEADTERIKSDYADCRQWIYCIYTGDCLSEALLQYYSEAAVQELQNALQQKRKNDKGQDGVSETKLVTWVRGAKQDWLATNPATFIVNYILGNINLSGSRILS
eukprot:gene732-13_t